jgi:hypothetical protein
MSLLNTEITLIAPTSGSGRDPDRDTEEYGPIRAWLKQISSERAAMTLGIGNTDIYKCRFPAPRSIRRQIVSGWRVRDADGTEYEITSSVLNPDGYILTLERA